MIYNKRTAPIVAVMIEPINPPVVKLSKLNTKPPKTAPAIPTRILPKRPNPLPFMILPASQPAKAPMAKNMIKLVISIMSLVFVFNEDIYTDKETDCTTNVESHFAISNPLPLKKDKALVSITAYHYFCNTFATL
jgi:hypothetical protein